MHKKAIALTAFVLTLSACRGGDTTPNPVTAVDTAVGGATASVEGFFADAVQPALAHCRTCHVPGGVADSDAGQRFLLSANPLEDYSRMRSAWQTLGEGVEDNALLIEPTEPAAQHSGGQPWPLGSGIYGSVKALLACWDKPEDCSLGAVGEVADLLPLLGSARGGHAWFDYCADGPNGQPRADSAVLPEDPRMLVQPGFNDDRAVYFNAWGKNCRIDPELVKEQPHPKNCGELRVRAARGGVIMGARPTEGENGTLLRYDDGSVVRPASTFEADRHNVGMSYQEYGDLWKAWNLGGDVLAQITGQQRPENFDELVVERYGLGALEDNNPYPVNDDEAGRLSTTFGGSGRLPRGLIQLRDEAGKYSGNIGANCLGCHGVSIDGEYIPGSGGAMLDNAVWSRDGSSRELGIGAGAERAGLGGKTRGTNNAQFANVISIVPVAEQVPEGGFTEMQFYEKLLGVLNSGSTASSDTPAWWNVGHRPVKFVDAMFPHDAIRVDLALFFPLFDYLNPAAEEGFAERWTSAHAQYVDLWIMSLKSPAYPLSVNTALAEQGAILFHTRNLWADDLNNPSPKPDGGNGSCASCHGAYSPRFVNDERFLAEPALEGIASYVVPLNLIGTDPVRSETFNEGSNGALSDAYIGYEETAGTEQDCRVQNLEELRNEVPGRTRPLGYAAPPLYGVWATAPYFHNGSVPNLAAVLDSSERPAIWRRLSNPAPAGLEGQVVMGYDSSLARGFDAERVGWNYEELDCSNGGSIPVLECDPVDSGAQPPAQLVIDEVFSNVLLAWNVTTPTTFTNPEIENRKIYNTHLYSQGNGGHAFTDVLSDAERRAIIEYLKAL